MSPMIVIVLAVVAGTVLVLGALIGASIHRETMRRQRRHNERERARLAHERMALDEQRRMADRG